MPDVETRTDYSKNVRLAAEIFSEHGCFIETVIKCRVRDEYLRKDIYHDFFLSLVKKPLDDNVQNVRSYLYRAVCNDINDRIRKIERYRKNLIQHNKQAVRNRMQNGPDESLERIEEADKLFSLIESKLTSNQANVIKMRHQEELSNSEIGDKLNVAAATVSSYYSVGLKQLRKILNRGEGDCNE